MDKNMETLRYRVKMTLTVLYYHFIAFTLIWVNLLPWIVTKKHATLCLHIIAPFQVCSEKHIVKPPNYRRSFEMIINQNYFCGQLHKAA